ncbi:MAG: prohibitin family protein [Clostridia bacterium]|nr:prohibitin family protein [Deltaproteobacteria bacterium]
MLREQLASNRGSGIIRVMFFIAVAFSAACAQRSTGSTEVGVRVNKLTGVENTIYAPGGTYFFLPFINDWYTFSSQTQAMAMTQSTTTGIREEVDDVEFKTRDGNDVGVDVTVLYRIDPQEAVHILEAIAVNDEDLREKVVRPLARAIVRDALNGLTSEEIYTEKKFQAGQEAVQNLNTALKPYGVSCENITLGDHRFHQRYQEAIINKKVFDQQVNTNRSAKEAAIGEWAAALEKTRGDVEQQIAQEQGSLQRTKLAADAYAYSKQKEAEGIVAQKNAEARGVIELNRAMASTGGKTNVRLALARALQGKRIVIVPSGGNNVGLQKMDVNDLVKTALATEATKRDE